MRDIKSNMIKPLTVIAINDLASYREFFAQDQRRACYGNSWTYITQACRELGLGYRYQTTDMLLSIGQYQGHYVIVRPLGQLDGAFMDVVTQLHQQSGKPVFIKKLFPDQVEVLQHLGSFSPAAYYCPIRRLASPGAYPWARPAFADDDTYPEMIFDLPVLLAYQTDLVSWFDQFQQAYIASADEAYLKKLRKHFKQYRLSLKYFKQANVSFALRPCDDSMSKAVGDFLADYFGPQRRDGVQAYRNMLAHSWAESGIHSFTAHVNGEDKPIGYACVEHLDEQSVGYYANITARLYPGLPEYFEIQVMTYLREQGYRYVTNGGSETRNLYLFKRKAAPVEERYMSMLVFNGHSRT